MIGYSHADRVWKIPRQHLQSVNHKIFFSGLEPKLLDKIHYKVWNMANLLTQFFFNHLFLNDCAYLLEGPFSL